VVAAPRALLKPAPRKAPTYEAVRVALLTSLEERAGGAIALPDLPHEKLLVWVDARNGAVASEDAARYRLLGEHLLIAAKLMESEDLPTRKRGYWIASESANFAAAQLKADKGVLARIYEGYLLPKVTLANTELWQDPSRSRILEQGVSAFGNAGERDKQIRVLEWIISVVQRKPEATTKKSGPEPLTLELNTLDWARGTLAATLSAPQCQTTRSRTSRYPVRRDSVARYGRFPASARHLAKASGAATTN